MTFELMHKVRVAVERKASAAGAHGKREDRLDLVEHAGRPRACSSTGTVRIIAANQFMADLMSCPPERMVGRSALDVISPSSQERASHLVERVAKTRKAMTFVTRAI